METLTARALTGQLADDLGWLEQHCRKQADQAHAASKLRLAAALVRNCIGPALDDQPPTPIHVVVVGGAGAGKSTIANLLSGATAAEANPQAGFTRHPIAYTSITGPLNWTGHVGFLGPLHPLTQPSPSSLDEDVYQVRRIPSDSTSFDLLKEFVVWDCPDMTTWAAGSYIPRLMEAAALADILVYVASDERYNDEVPTQLLHLLLQTGKPVVVCLMKMRESDAPALLAHFQKEVVRHLPNPPGGGVIAALAIPFLTPAQLADPARQAARYRIPLLNQVAVLGMPPASARRRTIAGAAQFLVRHRDQLLSVAQQDLQAMQIWQSVVVAGQADFEQRYLREYLTSEKFRGFDEALVRLMELLELPGIGKVLSGTLFVLRTPYRLVRGLVAKAISRPDAPGRPELPILEDALNGWIDQLRKEAARHADNHSLWAHVADGFHSDRRDAGPTGGLTERIRERFQQNYRNFQTGLTSEVDRTARAIYEQLEKTPAVLNTLRGSKFALDMAAIGGTLVAGGINWHDFILVPLVASLTHQLVELLGRSVVESQREQTRERQQALMKQHLSAPLAEWLTQWPATGGSDFERLQLALRRIPDAIAHLEARVQMAMANPAPSA
ncbi:MAG TPA: GTPase [Gemmataceae bacterium]|nr:GTPase [Gemmataceae bacterium]